MNGDGMEPWIELRRQAAIEQDPNKLFALTNEIILLLEEKQARLQANPFPARAQPLMPVYFFRFVAAASSSASRLSIS
jgi:hypothetical protein